MTWVDRLLRSLGYSPASKRFFRFDEELAQSLQVLAEREQRPADDLAADLLASALAVRQDTDELWQCWQALSPREQDVAALTCLGYTNRQIAARLGVSAETVKTHVHNTLIKFGLHGKSELRLVLADWDFAAWDDPPRR